jgi:probable HAF family extracellular repeat protein
MRHALLKRQLLFLAGAAIAFLGVVSPAYSQSQEFGYLYDGGSYTTITPPGSASSQLSGINASGQIVGNYKTSGGIRNFFLYSGGSYTNIAPPGSTSSSGGGINDLGQIVGSFDTSGGTTSGFLYSGGSYTTIAPPGSTFSDTGGINASGQIAGWYQTASGSGYGFLYRNGSYTTLAPPGSTPTSTNVGGVSSVINASGQIIGEFSTASSGGATYGFLYSPVPACVLCSNYTIIAPPGSTIGGYQSVTLDGINDLGQIVGTYNGTSFLYSNGSYTPIAPPGSDITDVDGINDLGQIVGSFDTSGSNIVQDFLYDNGTYTNIDLPGPPNGINDAGQIIGTYPTTPLPPTWTMMLAGLAGIGLLSYRRKKMGAVFALAAASPKH